VLLHDASLLTSYARHSPRTTLDSVTGRMQVMQTFHAQHHTVHCTWAIHTEMNQHDHSNIAFVLLSPEQLVSMDAFQRGHAEEFEQKQVVGYVDVVERRCAIRMISVRSSFAARLLFRFLPYFLPSDCKFSGKRCAQEECGSGRG
jgi:hypothetical protein